MFTLVCLVALLVTCFSVIFERRQIAVQMIGKKPNSNSGIYSYSSANGISQEIKLVTRSTQNKETENRIPTQSTSNSSWTYVDQDKNTLLLNAYVDTRKSNSIIILGLHNSSSEETQYYCRFRNETDEICPGTKGKLEYINRGDEKPGLHFWTIAIRCELPVHPEHLTQVKVATTKQCGKDSKLKWMPISNQSSLQKAIHNFTVCIETPLFGSKSMSRIIEGIERNLQFGADLITIYTQRQSDKVMKALREYEDKGKLEVIEWNLPQKGITFSHYFAESVLTSDCLYRHMYRSRFVVFTDLDEIIVPQTHRNWTSMLEAIDEPEISSFVFSHTSFMKAPKPTEIQKSVLPHWKCDSGSNLKQQAPVYTKHNYRTPPYPYHDKQVTLRTKVMVKPEYIIYMGIHDSKNVVKGTKRLQVPKDVGLLYHYREPALCDKCKDVISEDNRIHKLYPQLFDRITRKVCQYI